MTTQELIDYIKGELQKGTNEEAIKENLVKTGWKVEDVNEAFQNLNSPQPSQQNSPPSPPTAPNSSTNNNIYPIISIGLIQNPSRFYAVPLIGLLAKIIMLIPFFFVFLAVAIIAGVFSIINSFSVLFEGKYWEKAYKYNLASMRLTAKLNFFMFGLTNKYPGFSLDIKDNFSVDIPYPQNPSKLYAIPVIGILIRGILLIPFSIFSHIINQAVSLGVFLVASFYVLFAGKYPETIFEFARDYTRLSLASSAYTSGLSDKYPSFSISWKNKEKKIILIVIAVFLILFSNTISSVLSGLFISKTANNFPIRQNLVIPQQAVEQQRKAIISSIRMGLASYYVNHVSYPSSLEVLVPEYFKKIPEDPLGYGWEYAKIGDDYNLCTKVNGVNQCFNSGSL